VPRFLAVAFSQQFGRFNVGCGAMRDRVLRSATIEASLRSLTALIEGPPAGEEAGGGPDRIGRTDRDAHLAGRSLELLEDLVRRTADRAPAGAADASALVMAEVGSLRRSIIGIRSEAARQRRSLRSLRRHQRAAGRTLAHLAELLDSAVGGEEGTIPVGVVGSLDWRLDEAGDSLLLGPGCVYTHEGTTRENLWRELYMQRGHASRARAVLQVLQTALRRVLTGEPVIQDKYTAEVRGATLGISADFIGGNIVQVDLQEDVASRELIARRTVYFGSQEGVMLRLWSPAGLKRKLYGPGFLFQHFRVVPGCRGKSRVFLRVDGEVKSRLLGAGETLKLHPHYVYAFESSLGFELVEYGSVVGRLVRGDVPFWTRFRGPGRIWYSTNSFDDGYLGWLFTPAHWVYALREWVTALPKRILGAR